MDGPFSSAAGGVRVRLTVTPRAALDAVGEVVSAPDGGAALKVAVTAAPEGGKANQAVIRLLSRTWRVPKTSLSVVSGGAARRKLLHVSGETTNLMARLTEWQKQRYG